MNNLLKKLKNHRLILGSASPRRQQLLSDMGFDFIIKTADADESAPSHLDGFETAIFVARQKAKALASALQDDDILITADTEVWQGRRRFGKPKDLNEARMMLRLLLGNSHVVISGVCFTTKQTEYFFTVSTEVQMHCLSNEELEYYLQNGHPLDKAGAYGIQEWIGLAAIDRINGSYTNVVGMPMAELYRELTNFVNSLHS